MHLHRSLFPYLSTGLVYLNHAATSPLSTNVVAAMQLHLDRRSSGPVETYAEDAKFVPTLRDQVSRFVGAEGPERIALFGNTSDALNVVVSGLRWSSGDRVILNDMEFPANVYPYLALRRHGVEIDTIACPGNIITPDMIASAITPRTKVVALSAVQFLAGYKPDLPTIGDLCRSKGILFFVDGIQAVGATVIDVQQMKIDMMAAGAQKWLMGPQGTGFLYLSEAVQEMVDQQHLGWLSVETPWDFRDYSQPLAGTARRYELGTWNMAGLKGMSAALSTLLDIGRENLEERIRYLTGLLLDRLVQLRDLTIISPREPEHRAGIVTFRAGDGATAQRIFDALLAERITISIREGLLRISPHFYNVEEELERCVDVLRKALRSKQ